MQGENKRSRKSEGGGKEMSQVKKSKRGKERKRGKEEKSKRKKHEGRSSANFLRGWIISLVTRKEKMRKWT